MNTSPEVFVLPGLRSPFCKIDRELGRLDALEAFLPRPEVSPMELLRAGGRERRRASARRDG